MEKAGEKSTLCLSAIFHLTPQRPSCEKLFNHWQRLTTLDAGRESSSTWENWCLCGS